MAENIKSIRGDSKKLEGELNAISKKREISLVAKNPDVGKMLYTLFFKTRS